MRGAPAEFLVPPLVDDAAHWRFRAAAMRTLAKHKDEEAKTITID